MQTKSVPQIKTRAVLAADALEGLLSADGVHETNAERVMAEAVAALRECDEKRKDADRSLRRAHMIALGHPTPTLPDPVFMFGAGGLVGAMIALFFAYVGA